jgi:hypothetical protein
MLHQKALHVIEGKASFPIGCGIPGDTKRLLGTGWDADCPVCDINMAAAAYYCSRYPRGWAVFVPSDGIFKTVRTGD